MNDKELVKEKCIKEIGIYFAGYVPSKAMKIKEKAGECIDLAFEKGKQKGFKKGEYHTLNSFLLWLDWLVKTPKKGWEEQIKTKANQIFIEVNKGEEKSND